MDICCSTFFNASKPWKVVLTLTIRCDNLRPQASLGNVWSEGETGKRLSSAGRWPFQQVVWSSLFSICFFPGRSISKAWNEDQSPSNHIWGGDTLRPIFVMSHDGNHQWWGKYMQLLWQLNKSWSSKIKHFCVWNPWVIAPQGPKLWDYCLSRL